MGKIIEPKIQVKDIKIQADSGLDAQNILNEWPRRIPIVQINDYVLQIGQLLDFSVFTGDESGSSSVPTFRMKVEDTNYVIQEALRNSEIDTCSISFGIKDWLIKFSGIITSMSIRSGKNILYLYGVWYNSDTVKLYNSEQVIYKDKSVLDILKEICDSVNIGLFTYDNEELTKQIDTVINPNIQTLDFIQQLISRYTTNLYAFDIWGYLHIGRIKEIITKPIDKYTFTQETFEKTEATDIIFKIGKTNNYSPKDEKKINVTNYSITNDFSISKVSLSSNYFLSSTVEQGEGKQQIELFSDKNIGIPDEECDNTFHGFIKIPGKSDTFSSQKQSFRSERISKTLVGNKIELELQAPIFELTPYSLVGIEMYHDISSEALKDGIRFDKEHSGKYIVLSIEYKYVNNNGDLFSGANQVIQILKLFKPHGVQSDMEEHEMEQEPENSEIPSENVQRSTVLENEIEPGGPSAPKEIPEKKIQNKRRVSTKNLKVSERLINHIKASEGLRLKAYKCAANQWTIGYGHTTGVSPNMVITAQQADKLLRQDLVYFENHVRKKVPTASQGEFDALVSICFGTGPSVFDATGIATYHNTMSPIQTAKKITHTAITAKGTVLNGLVTRRLKESKIYLS